MPQENNTNIVHYKYCFLTYRWHKGVANPRPCKPLPPSGYNPHDPSPGQGAVNVVGKTLGHYEILEPLGKGGMGEVYRAHDPNLKRDVAIKVLPEKLAADPDRLALLEREAHSLAALNHPNVATIHGLEEADDIRFLVLELVEGDTLAERLGAGPLEVEEALGIAQQIAEGLEAAHGNGIIHRDLKPANIKVTPEGRVKVLDFGLAKPTEAEDDGAEGLTHSPTATVEGTAAGVLLGTAPYMSPEQAKGRVLDKRTDIWAFGCVLFEMLTGRRPFEGENVTDTLAAVLKEEPDWGLLPPDTPPLAGFLLCRCLRKEPNRRLHDIADARIEIEEVLSAPMEDAPVTSTVAARRWVWVLGSSIVIVVAISAAFLGGRATRSTGGAVQRFTISLPTQHTLSTLDAPPLALSPDASVLVFAALGPDGISRLYRRPLDGFEAEAIPGSEDAKSPFFSPDGQWVGFVGP